MNTLVNDARAFATLRAQEMANEQQRTLYVVRERAMLGTRYRIATFKPTGRGIAVVAEVSPR